MRVPSDPEASEEGAVSPADTAPTGDTPDPPCPGRPSTGPAPKIVTLALVAAAVWGIDLKSKMLAVDHLEWRPPTKLFNGLVYLQLVRNPGAAFGLATGMTWLLTLIAIGVVVAIVRVADRLYSRGWAVALGLVLGGALGNLTDRVFRYPGIFRGWVVDMVSALAPDGKVWPVFNAADSAICIGGVLLVLLALVGTELDGSRGRNPE
jgi:signal peptidase II